MVFFFSAHSSSAIPSPQQQHIHGSDTPTSLLEIHESLLQTIPCLKHWTFTPVKHTATVIIKTQKREKWWRLRFPPAAEHLTGVSDHPTNTKWFLMDRLDWTGVTGVGMSCCSIGSDSENTQGLLLYSLTVINNVVHKDWNLINIFKLCFDIFSSSYKSTCAAVWLQQSFNCLNHSPTGGWLCLTSDNKNTEIQM